MKQLLYQSLSRAQLPRALAVANRRNAVILMYHGFTDNAAHAGVENYQGLHQHVDMFRRHLQYLRDHFHPISLQQLLEHYRTGQPLPPNPAVVTIDDGYQSNYALAFPLLRQFQIPATIFLTTGFVDGKRLQWTDRVEYAVNHAAPNALAELAQEPLPAADSRGFRGRALVRLKAGLKGIPQDQRAARVDQIEAQLGCSLATAADVPPIYLPLEWAQVREMAASGLVTFGSHTDSHFILSRCTPEVVRDDLHTAKRIIEERTGGPCPLFCYPNGAAGDFDAMTRAVVQEVGHVCALTTVQGFNDARADVYALRRVGVLDGQSFDDFVMTVAGVSPWLTKVGDGLRRVGIR